MANVMLVEGWGLAGTITDDLGPDTPPTLAALGWTATSGSNRDNTLSVYEDDAGQGLLEFGSGSDGADYGISLCRYAGAMEGDVVMGFSVEIGEETASRLPGMLFSGAPFSTPSSAEYFVCVRTLGDGSLSLSIGSTGTNGTPTTISQGLINGAANWVELVLKRSEGTVEFWLNNRLAATAEAPADLIPMTHVAASTNAFRSATPAFGSATSVIIGALYVADERLGRCQVITRRPTSDAAVEFTRAQGDSNASQVADPDGADGDTTYVSSATSGAEDLYASSDAVDLTNERVHAVAVTTTARKEDVGNRSITPIVSQGSSVAAGEPATLQIDSYVGTQSVFSVDPATGSAWTVSGAESSTFGARLTD